MSTNALPDTQYILTYEHKMQKGVTKNGKYKTLIAYINDP